MLDNVTFLAALDFEGGPTIRDAAQILLRQAVAAYLNSLHPTIEFSLSSAQVVSQTNAALATLDRGTILALASDLDRRNNAGCPDAKSLNL